MPKTKTEKNVGMLFKIADPPLYNVIMYNDDVTTMDFVVHVLITHFKKPKQVAIDTMLKIHKEGSAVVGTYFFDIARSKAEKVMALAKGMGFPLKLTIEEV